MNSQLETQLSDDLSQIVAGQPFVPDIEAIGRRGRLLRRRSAAARSAAGLGAAAGLTAIALAVSSAQAGRAHPAAAGPAHQAARSAHQAAGPPPSAQAIQARTIAAVSSATSSSVLRTVAITASQVIRSTVDAPDQAVNVVIQNTAGQPVSEIATRRALGTAGQDQAIAINFTAHTWGEMHIAGTIKNPATRFLAVFSHITDFKPSLKGQVRYGGTAVIDGQPAYKIVITGQGTYWISKATSLPIKSVSPWETVTFQWSGPGTVNPASLWPGVPAGFTKIAPRLAADFAVLLMSPADAARLRARVGP